MRTFSREFRCQIAAAALAVLVTIAHVDASRAETPRNLIAGIAYDASAPLEPVVTPKFDTTHPPAILTYAVKFRGAEGQYVPAIFITSGTPGPKPAILFQHGLGGKKEDVYIAAVIFAKQGYSALAIDAAGHGARPEIDGKPLMKLDISEMHHLCGETIIDLRRAVDWLQTRPEVDRSRIGFLGISLGAILGGVFVADEPRISAAALWAAGGNWGTLITTSTHALAIADRKAGMIDAAKVESIMSDVDPLNDIATVSPRPLLFLNGDADTVVPVACAQALYAAAGQPKERVLLPGGHIPDAAAMLGKSLEWMGKQMGPTAPPK